MRGQALTLAITTGEPAGIGPELTLAALAYGARTRRWGACRFVVLGDAVLLAERARAAGLDTAWVSAAGTPDASASASDQCFIVEGPTVDAAVTPGVLDPRNGPYVLRLLDLAIDGALSGAYDGIVTAPLQKSTINDAGVPFTGHTEYLAERTGTEQVVMMLAGPVSSSAHGAVLSANASGAGVDPESHAGGNGAEAPVLLSPSDARLAASYMFRVALATTHLPLSQVPQALNVDMLVRTLEIIDADLRRDFAIAQPQILVTGLNPHAGESGYLGREEIDVIAPALARARQAGIDARGPYPADTLFQPRHLADADCVLAMYHDQGLPVLKYATFGEGINVTLGLPIVRVSVDHGTALDLAGTGRADPGSMLAAIDTAVQMARNRRAHQDRPMGSSVGAPVPDVSK
ncbi:4-hydroxythreonine-4-phosphate dehydrogenase PdxA [Robbsia sp. KACC 23696]|uniref:4-hydroxythreonine-4-phosphate dehydrogenase PdxA n=1 Tax=Robbsia sp. KACC 23696 TaxID=3149231 RepID=UPI00325AE7F9